jgi:hypothetical protein
MGSIATYNVTVAIAVREAIGEGCHRETALQSPIRWFSKTLGTVTN